MNMYEGVANRKNINMTRHAKYWMLGTAIVLAVLICTLTLKYVKEIDIGNGRMRHRYIASGIVLYERVEDCYLSKICSK